MDTKLRHPWELQAEINTPLYPLNVADPISDKRQKLEGLWGNVGCGSENWISQIPNPYWLLRQASVKILKLQEL